MDINELSKPFTPSSIKWRVGSTDRDKTKGMALAYADARAFMDRLDEVCGADGWQDEVFDSPSGRVFCKVSLKIGGEWISKMDGAGETDVEGDKGAISDAFKRACVKWGLGRYLYDIDSPWVEIEPRGKSYVIKASEKQRLLALVGGNKPNRQTQATTQATPSPKATSQPASKNEPIENDGLFDDEPRDPMTVKAELIGASASKGSGAAKENQLKFVRSSLAKLTGSDNTKAKTILKWVFNIDSSTELTTGQASALIDWAGANKENEYTVNAVSAQEAERIVTAAIVGAGQQPLFDEGPDLGAYAD